MLEDLFCYVHASGVIEINSHGSVKYMGGTTIIMQICKTICYVEFINDICAKLPLDTNVCSFYYMAAVGNLKLAPLIDDSSLEMMVSTTGNLIHVYVISCPLEQGAEGIVLRKDMSCIVGASAEHNSIVGTGFSRRCAEIQMKTLEASRWKNAIAGSGQTFQTAAEFRNALYLMSIAGRFKYYFKRNNPKHISVVCKAKGCKWKITCRSVGGSKVVRVHTFHNVHNHRINDIPMNQPDVKSKHASEVVDAIIGSTPEYQPRQLCKDFLREHGIHLSYHQAWNLKEKAKERLYGQPKSYYKLLPWICERIRATNPDTVTNLTYTHDTHFHQLFIAHGFSIHGFANGCRPLIALDSCHMSGPYGGALFAANAYDANDSLLPIAFGIVSNENYEDWSWFLQNLKGVLGNREVVIISDRHPSLLRAVPEVFGADNHSYCYRHVKENFSSYVTKHSKRGENSKIDALAFLDGIAYARLGVDYETALSELRRFNTDFSSWVETNSPHHWAMSKYPKKRWDKITTNLAESYNSWLKMERHNSISTFLVQHMVKMANMLVRRKTEMKKWDGMIGPRIKAKLQYNLVKGETYPVYRFLNDNFGVQVGQVLVNVNMTKRTCTCKSWDMSGIPCEHACAVILFNKLQPCAFVDEWYTAAKQEMIYGGELICLETHELPTIGADGVVRDAAGNIIFSLLPPFMKRKAGRPKTKRNESQFMEKRPIYCSRCQQPGHNRRRCRNPIVFIG